MEEKNIDMQDVNDDADMSRMRIFGEIFREILEIPKTLSPQDALEKVKNWQSSLSPFRNLVNRPFLPLGAQSVASNDPYIDALPKRPAHEDPPGFAPPDFSAAMDAGLKLWVDTRPYPSDPPPGFEEALKAGLGKLLADTGVNLATIPESVPVPAPAQLLSDGDDDDISHRPSSKKVAKFLGLSVMSARQRIAQNRDWNRQDRQVVSQSPFMPPTKLLQKKIKASQQEKQQQQKQQQMQKKNSMKLRPPSVFGTGTLVKVVLDDGTSKPASVIDYIGKSSSYRVSFDDFSVMTVPAKKVIKIADNPSIAYNVSASSPALLRPQHEPDPVSPPTPPPLSMSGVPGIGPPSDEPRTSVAQRPDVLPPPKFAPSGEKSNNSNWMATPPPPVVSPRESKQNPHTNSSEAEICVGELATALFPYDGGREDELTVEPGQKVRVLQIFNDGWVLGRVSLTRQVGVLPGNYLGPRGTAVSADVRDGKNVITDYGTS